LPPALLRGVLGQAQQQIAPWPGDLVVVEQPRDLLRPQPGPGPLVPADLGWRPLQRGRHRVAALALALPDPAQFGGQPAAPHRGASWRDHRACLLLGARGRAGAPVTQVSLQELVKPLVHATPTMVTVEPVITSHNELQ